MYIACVMCFGAICSVGSCCNTNCKAESQHDYENGIKLHVY